MLFKVAVTTERLPLMREVFDKRGIEVVQRDCRTEDEVIETAKDADGIMIWITPLTSRHVIESLPKCKVISRRGVGVDSVDLDAATENGVMVCHLPGLNSASLAEGTMSLLLALTRQVVGLSHLVKAGSWTERPKEIQHWESRMTSVAGSVVGIIGLGNIGRAFALRVRAFAPDKVLAYDPYVHQLTADTYGVRMVDLDTLLRESDFISIHAPETKGTHSLIGAQEFQKMKRTAYLINTSRGGLVDTKSLIEALENQIIAGAALDVTDPEPINPDNPLLKMDNVVITPHRIGRSQRGVEVGLTRWAESVALVLAGKEPHGLANPEVRERIVIMKAEGHPRWANVPRR